MFMLRIEFSMKRNNLSQNLLEILFFSWRGLLMAFSSFWFSTVSCKISLESWHWGQSGERKSTYDLSRRPKCEDPTGIISPYPLSLNKKLEGLHKKHQIIEDTLTRQGFEKYRSLNHMMTYLLVLSPLFLWA